MHVISLLSPHMRRNNLFWARQSLPKVFSILLHQNFLFCAIVATIQKDF
jgi:hypothetical protein